MLKKNSLLTLASCIALSFFATTTQAEKPVAETAEKSHVLDVFGAKMTVPKAFKETKPGNRMIHAEFKASEGKGEEAKTARVYMMPSGGGIEPNVKRWEDQFPGGDEKAEKREEIKLGEWKAHIVDVNGTFAEKVGGGGPFAPGKTVQRPDYAMTGAIVVHPEGRLYFVKMVGPMSVVKANRKAFVEMIKSVKP